MAYDSAKGKLVLLVFLAALLGVILFRDAIFQRFRTKLEVTVQAGISPKTLSDAMQGLKFPPMVAAWHPPAAVDTHVSDPMRLPLSETSVRIVSEPNVSASTPDPNTARGTPVKLDEKTPVFWVKGIVYSRVNRSSVILENGILGEGDEIYGARVAHIGRHSVQFKKNGTIYRVRVGQGGAK